ncbi:MAG TPA: hypothetical protein PK762_09820 [Candidatus Kapabacteria bacterium]|nr:hypothetical protein [Candidatus Kapabacteria bacterium]
MISEDRKEVRNQIFKALKYQFINNDPPETKLTYKRLREMGYSAIETKKYLANCLFSELFNMTQENRVFDYVRYKRLLNNLPKLPTEDD